MEMKTVTKNVFVAEDGAEFLSKEECEAHEEKLAEIKYFKIYAHPDLTEGRHGPKFVGYGAVCATTSHNEFAEHACYELYGSKVAFVMGAFGSNAMMANWVLGDETSVKPSSELLFTVQDKFSKTQAFEPGINKFQQREAINRPKRTVQTNT